MSIRCDAYMSFCEFVVDVGYFFAFWYFFKIHIISFCNLLQVVGVIFNEDDSLSVFIYSFWCNLCMTNVLLASQN